MLIAHVQLGGILWHGYDGRVINMVYIAITVRLIAINMTCKIKQMPAVNQIISVLKMLTAKLNTELNTHQPRIFFNNPLT